MQTSELRLAGGLKVCSAVSWIRGRIKIWAGTGTTMAKGSAGILEK